MQMQWAENHHHFTLSFPRWLPSATVNHNKTEKENHFKGLNSLKPMPTYY